MLISQRERIINQFPIDPNWRETSNTTVAIFDSLDGWSSMQGVLDTELQYQGRPTIRFTGGGTKGTYLFHEPLDMSDVDYIDVVMMVNRAYGQTANAFVTNFSDGVNEWSPDLRPLFPYTVKDGFIKVRLSLKKLEAIDWSNIKTIRIWMASDAEEPVFQVNIAQLNMVSVDKAVIRIDFDDASPSVHSTAFPIMHNLAIPGTFFVITNEISNWDNLHELANAGWLICNHTHTHMELRGTDSTDDEKIIDVMRAQEILKHRGFHLGARFLATPGGFAPTGKVLDAVMNSHIMIRGVASESNAYGSVGGASLGAVAVTKSHTIDDIKGWVDTAVQRKRRLNLLFHQIVETPTIYTQWPTSDFQALCEHIANYRDLGLAEVGTIKDYWIPYSGDIYHAKGKDYLIGHDRNTKIKIELP